MHSTVQLATVDRAHGGDRFGHPHHQQKIIYFRGVHIYQSTVNCNS